MEETTGIIVVAAVVLVMLIAVCLSTGAIIWQMSVQDNRRNSRTDVLDDRLSGEIEALSAKVRAHGEELTEVRREQARLEGSNRVLEQQSHTHPPNNPPSS